MTFTGEVVLEKASASKILLPLATSGVSQQFGPGVPPARALLPGAMHARMRGRCKLAPVERRWARERPGERARGGALAGIVMRGACPPRWANIM